MSEDPALDLLRQIKAQRRGIAAAFDRLVLDEKLLAHRRMQLLSVFRARVEVRHDLMDKTGSHG